MFVPKSEAEKTVKSRRTHPQSSHTMLQAMFSLSDDADALNRTDAHNASKTGLLLLDDAAFNVTSDPHSRVHDGNKLFIIISMKGQPSAPDFFIRHLHSRTVRCAGRFAGAAVAAVRHH